LALLETTARSRATASDALVASRKHTVRVLRWNTRFLPRSGMGPATDFRASGVVTQRN
jgi:hypothetical protein